MDVLDLELHLLAQLLVEGAQRLVHQHQLRLEDQRAGQRHALLLAARELGRAPIAEGAELHHVEGALDAGLDLRFRQSPHLKGKARFSSTVMCGKSA